MMLRRQGASSSHQSVYLFSVTFLVGLLFFAGQLAAYHYQLISFPYQISYRESAAPMFTDLLLAGGFPYQIEDHPEYSNFYGMFYSLVTYPLAMVFGSSVHIHRLVTGFFIIATCAIVYAVMRKRKVGAILAFAAVLLLYAGFLWQSTPRAKPDALGMFLFLSAIFLPWWYKFSVKSLAGSIILGLLALFTKQYFVLALPCISGYLFLFVSKRKAIIYTLAAILSIGLSLTLMANIFELYIYDTVTIPRRLCCSYSLGHMREQLLTFITWYRELILLCIAIALTLVIKASRANGIPPILEHINVRNLFNIGDWKRPLLSISLDPHMFFLLVITMVIIYPLGGHTGNNMTYLMQLISPFFLIVIFSWLNPFVIKMKECNVLAFIAVIALLLKSLHTFTYEALNPLAFDEGLEAWVSAEKLISKSENVLNSSTIASILLEQGKTVYNSGLSEYFIQESSTVTDLRKRVVARSEDYKSLILNGITESSFDLLLINDGSYDFIPQSLLETHYGKEGVVALDFPHSKITRILEIWKPLSKDRLSKLQ